MYVGDIQSKLKNRLKQHLYINIVIKQHSSNSSGMQRYYKIIIYPRCYVILMKLYSPYISSITLFWFKEKKSCAAAMQKQATLSAGARGMSPLRHPRVILTVSTAL